MKIAVTGAGGFIGKRLIERLLQEGHELRTLGRRPVSGLSFSQWDSLGSQPPDESLAGADAIVHLAGEPVAQRWSPEVKRRIHDSRINGTRNLVHALSTQSRRPKVLVAASACGIYGPRGDEILTESSVPGQGFLPDVCTGWEREARMAEALGMRVVNLRIGIVLGKGGGALEQMLPPFRAGVGGRLGSGKQWMPWIHIEDIVGLLLLGLQDPQVGGPVNGAAPKPVTNADFTAELAKTIHRPALFTIPPLALRLLYGEMSQVLLASQRILPKAAEAAGYRFQFPHLSTALGSILH